MLSSAGKAGEMGRGMVKPPGNLRETSEREPQETDPLADLLDGWSDIDLGTLFDDVDVDAILADLAADWSLDLAALLDGWNIDKE